MKKIALQLTVSLLFCFIFIPDIKAQQNKALIYMNKISKELNAIMVDSWDYTAEVAHGKSARKAEIKRKELLKSSKLAMERVSKMEGFEGNMQFRDSILSFLEINYIIMNEDYAKILNMEEIAEQSYDKMEAYMLARQLAEEKLDIASDRMIEQQKIFATNHNIILTENQSQLTRKLAKSGEVYKHYNQVYLIYFKSLKQEAYLLEAISKKDISSLEQNKNALISVSQEGLNKLKTIAAYNYDKSIIGAAKTSLDFYELEATSKISPIVDFYLEEEKFENIKTAFEAKPQSSRTKADIDLYNAAVKDLNNKMNTYNKIITELNNSRLAAYNNWERTSKNFLDRHIPKYK